jgi:XTP/dITP diphosphohydrolase
LNKTLLIGTGNPNKVNELREILKHLPWQVKSLSDFPEVPAPEENGATFAENALLKARYYAGQFKTACIADDSGLEVDALDSAPGVISARYAGPEQDAAKNNAKLLRELEDYPWHARSARFVCCAAFADPEGAEHTESGVIEGHLAVEMFGDGGFGYDPLFVPEGEDRTFAEMPAEEKNAMSHRARAFLKLAQWLETRP